MESKIISLYKIIYENGVIQIKGLIEHSDYLNDIKPTETKIDFLEVKKKTKDAEYLKRELKSKYGTFWFTNESPLFDAIVTGYLSLPICQGGETKCNVIKI